ncbi:MAG: ABC transporter substrate-binding protein [Planctomycetota bacterium]|jgi:ABC-type hemin transport system substrate-binding protein
MRPSSPLAGAVVVQLLAALLAGGCRRTETPAKSAPTPPGEPRIVSLSPALSRTLLDFGLGERIVGRTPFCSSLDPEIPVVGSLYDVDYERLIRLEPTHVVVQPPASGTDPQLLRLARQHGWTVGQWTVNTIEDIERTIRALPGTLYQNQSAPRARAAHRAAELLNEIAASLSPGGEDLWRGRTLMVSGTDPVLAFGRRTYLHDILSAMDGANAVTAEGWVELSLEDVLRMDPEAIIIVRDRGPDDPVAAAGVLGSLDIAAVRAGRITVLRHPDAHLPSSGVIGVGHAMRAVLGRLAESEP